MRHWSECPGSGSIGQFGSPPTVLVKASAPTLSIAFPVVVHQRELFEFDCDDDGSEHLPSIVMSKRGQRQPAAPASSRPLPGRWMSS